MIQHHTMKRIVSIWKSTMDWQKIEGRRWRALRKWSATVSVRSDGFCLLLRFANETHPVTRIIPRSPFTLDRYRARALPALLYTHRLLRIGSESPSTGYGSYRPHPNFFAVNCDRGFRCSEVCHCQNGGSGCCWLLGGPAGGRFHLAHTLLHITRYAYIGSPRKFGFIFCWVIAASLPRDPPGFPPHLAGFVHTSTFSGHPGFCCGLYKP